MIRCSLLIREGRDAFIAHQFAGQPLTSPYNKGTKSAFWWSRGVELARRKVGELMEIGG
ncbi:hypothetical protein [Novosphingobium sp. M1R2S20]|uniref:Uncharacterized protein n=1 Tax=Novosphingobium rhizovicinum TaxID=3228928 RepID=A0ABV3RCU0_9SPHN